MHRHQRRPATRPAWMEEANPRVEIRLLGGFEVTVDGTVTSTRDWTRRSAAALVKVLAMVPGHRLHREQVMDMLWPDDPLREAAPKLHKAAHFARKAAGRHDAIVLLNDTVHLFPGGGVTVDVATFEELARDAIARNDAAAAELALAHYGGELLPADPYEEWASDRRELLRRRHLELLRLAGRWVELAELDPTDEDAHVQLMQHLAGVGNCTAALREFRNMELVLGREFGVTPGREAREVRDRIEAGCGGERTDDRPVASVVHGTDRPTRNPKVTSLLAEMMELTRRQAELLEHLAAAGWQPTSQPTSQPTPQPTGAAA